MFDNMLNNASGQLDLFTTTYDVGDRVELHPATNRWMAGDRFGTVVKIGRVYLHVLMDVSEQTCRVVPENVGRKLVPGEQTS